MKNARKFPVHRFCDLAISMIELKMKCFAKSFPVALLLLLSISLTAQKSPIDPRDDRWYKNSIIYTFHINTFQDSDGDGIGDFKGAMRRLDYLNALGVDVIWLAPFQCTADKDDGYDITDYYTVDPRYGSNGDFVEFIHQADKLGIRVVIDLVANHTSNEHPWFRQAEQSRTSKFRAWYTWSDERPSDWKKDMVFPGVQKETWTFDSAAGQYYYHKFYKFQPELNYTNPDVQAALNNIMAYWLKLGVSGFRLDAVPFIIEMRGSGKDKPREDFDMINRLERFINLRKAGAIMLGEANVLPQNDDHYFGKEGEGINMMFNFYANQYLFYALATADVKPFQDALKQTHDIPPISQWAFFLRNHDELDLGRLTEKQRDKVFHEFGPDTTMQLYDRGIRRRLGPMLKNDRKRLELAYSLLFSLPGTPVMRYGDEIGMGDNLALQERESVRTPMQWDASRNAGFSIADKTKKPVINFGAYDYHTVNVEAQRTDPNSLLNWMTHMIRCRKECAEIGTGDWEILPTTSPHVLVIQYNKPDRSLLTICNFSSESQTVDLTLENASTPKSVLDGHHALTKNQNATWRISLQPYDYCWFRVR